MSPAEVAQVQEALRRCLATPFRDSRGQVRLVCHKDDLEELGEAILPMPEGDEFRVETTAIDRGYVTIWGPGLPCLRLPSAPPEPAQFVPDVPGGTAGKIVGPSRSYVE